MLHVAWVLRETSTLFIPVPWLLRESSHASSVVQTGYGCDDVGAHLKLFNTTYAKQQPSTLNVDDCLENEGGLGKYISDANLSCSISSRSKIMSLLSDYEVL